MSDVCAQCAEKLLPGARYCSVCGFRVVEKRTAHSRYMSVLFCDLTGSTSLTEELGDETMFEIVTRYQDVCNEVVREHGGFVAKYMGDGMLAYFGYPETLTNSAAPAVLSALQIIERLQEITVPGGKLSASAGIATGWMVVGDASIGAAAAESMAIGGTVNLASRIQSEAGPGRVAVSVETGQRLDATQFTLSPLGTRKLRGFADPVVVWRVSKAEHVHHPRVFVGRAPMRAALHTAWERAQNGEVVSAILSGPGGYGKTSLAESFLEETVGESGALVMRGQRHRREQSFAAFRPFVLKLAGVSASSSRSVRKAALASWAPEGAAPALHLLCDLNDEPVPPMLRVQMIETALMQTLKERFPETPAILLLDDAHWFDADSARLVGQLPGVLQGHSLMILATRRPEGTEIPLPDAVEIELGRMDDCDVEAVISALDAAGTISPEMRARIAERAEGVPLFVEHITRAVLERPGATPGDTIPSSMIEALLERFSHLGKALELVEAAAILGVEVRVDVLAAMLGSDKARVAERLAGLISRGLFRPGGEGAVAFDHSLIREAVMGTLLASQTRKLHAAALAAYRKVAPARLLASPVTAAFHLSGSGRTAEAIPKLIEAAQTAMTQGDIAESVRLLNFAEVGLESVPKGDARDDLEMRVKFSQGLALVQHRGFSDAAVAEAYGRALELCLADERGGETEFQIAWGIWAHYVVIGEVDRALSLTRRMDEIAAIEPSLEVLAAAARSVVLWNQGDLGGQEAAADKVCELYVPELHRHQAITYSMDSLELAWLFRIHGRYIAGDLPNWRAAHAAALEHEAFLKMPFLKPYIRIYSTAPHSYAHSDENYRPELEEAVAYAAEIGQPFWVIAGQVWLAQEAVRNDTNTNAVTAMQAAVDQMRAIGSNLGLAYHVATLARCLALAGRAQDANAAIAGSVAAIEAGRDQIYAPEVYRLWAEVTILNDPEAVRVAREHLDQAKRMAERNASRAWLALIAGSRARLMVAEIGEGGAQDWLDSTLADLALPGSMSHPAFKSAQRALSAPV